VRTSTHDAVEVLREQIAPGSLDEVLVLFPDPWHKKRHHKRRLIQPPFVELIASRLRVGGVLRLATDWEEYATQMLEVLSGASALFTNLSPTGDWMPRPEERAPTRFEKRGRAIGSRSLGPGFRAPDYLIFSNAARRPVANAGSSRWSFRARRRRAPGGMTEGLWRRASPARLR
jgi:hypothetical protein